MQHQIGGIFCLKLVTKSENRHNSGYRLENLALDFYGVFAPFSGGLV